MVELSEVAVRKLAGMGPTGAPVLTCYLDVDGRYRRSQGEVLQAFDRLAAFRVRRGSEARALARDVDRLRSWLRGLDRRGVRGAAAFACEPAGLFETVTVPLRFTDQLVVNAEPAVFQLEAALASAQRLGVLLVDRQRARLVSCHLGRLTEVLERDDPLERRGADVRGEQVKTRVEQQRADQVHHHVKRAAQLAFEAHQSGGFDRLLLGGPPEVLTDLEQALHPYLRRLVAARLPVGPGASDVEVLVAASEAEERLERQEQAASVVELRSAADAHQRGVVGLKPTLRALAERRAERLFVSRGYSAEGWRCDACGQLATIGRVCPRCSATMVHVGDVVEEAVHAALRQRCRVEVCTGSADLDVAGRIGALLRYA